MITTPLSPAPTTGPTGSDLPAYVANGLVGLRVREVPFLAGSAIVNGVAGTDVDAGIEAAIAIPYPLAADVCIDRAWLSDQPWVAEDLRQSYDFNTAELLSEFILRFDGIALSVAVTTFASRSHPALVVQHSIIRAEHTCKIGLRSLVDPRTAQGRMTERVLDHPAAGEASLLWVPEGDLSCCGIAMHSHCSRTSDGQMRSKLGSGPLVMEFEVELKAGQTVELDQIAALIPSIVHHRPREEAVRRMSVGARLGVPHLQKLNRECWSGIWKGRITIEGASPRHQQLIDAGFFYLQSSAHRSSPAATSMFGLAYWPNYHYYYGHVMWDIDAFCVPPLLLLQPDAARSLIDFRARHVEAARRYARLDGLKGMRFPWQAAPTTGEEAAPGDGPAAANAAHLSLHVARAFSLHADCSGDERYLREQGWPIISGVADWLTDRLTRTAQGISLLHATGPAEVPDPPDDDSFTLMTAADLLKRAIRTAHAIGADIPRDWQDTLSALHLPCRSDGVIPSHRDFRIDEPKGATPGPLAGLFPMNYPASKRQRRATLDFFLAHWRDYIGSPMLAAFYPAWAAMAGDRELAMLLFEQSYAAYDAGRFHQCLEYRMDHPDSAVPAGPFLANIGGMLMTMLLGLPGLEISDESPKAWAKRPVVLPSGWSAIHVDRLWARGQPMKLVAGQGMERAQLLPA
ncbi:hypothetical protein [Sphingobium sp.]|uniref:hypothetical protein n=1 Tax=Sphingobium sp. TaxID=1912891 RepID=UPI002B7E2142|nr:hypothetical protein [Sphingobium sp.]HUD95852.1 hypothetical protein [Sphingobium sp.]